MFYDDIRRFSSKRLRAVWNVHSVKLSCRLLFECAYFITRNSMSFTSFCIVSIAQQHRSRLRALLLASFLWKTNAIMKLMSIMNEWKNEWTNERMDGWMNEWKKYIKTALSSWILLTLTIFFSLEFGILFQWNITQSWKKSFPLLKIYYHSKIMMRERYCAKVSKKKKRSQQRMVCDQNLTCMLSAIGSW